MARWNDFVDEGRPIVWPLLLQDGNKDQIKFVQKGAFASETLFWFRALNDKIDDEVSDT